MYAKVNEIRIININGEHIGVKIIRTAEYPFYTLAVGADLWQSLESFYNINLPTARRLINLLEKDKEKGFCGITNYLFDKKCNQKMWKGEVVKNSELRSLIKKMI